MQQTTITLKRPHVNQQVILKDRTRYRVASCGRRFGKSELAIDASVHRLLRGQTIWYCSPTYKNSKRVWRQYRDAVRGLPGVVINNSDMRAEFRNGSIEFVSTHEHDNLRGAGLDFAVLDEAAFMHPDVWPKVIQPMLLTTQGAALFLSSPNGRNWFWEIFQRGLDNAEVNWSSYHFTSYDNPLIPAGDIDEIRRSVPERVFLQEYLGEFLDDGGAVFRNLQACLVEPADKAQGRVVFGVDLGRHNDYTVIYVMDAQTRRVLAWDRFTEIGWDIQRTRIEALARKWKPSTIWMEENFNDSFVEQLQGAGWPVRAFRTTNASKQQIINELALAFEQADIGIPNEPVLLGELQAYTLERLPGGTFRYGAPDGLHDDCVMALALAWHGARIPMGAKIVENPFY